MWPSEILETIPSTDVGNSVGEGDVRKFKGNSVLSRSGDISVLLASAPAIPLLPIP